MKKLFLALFCTCHVAAMAPPDGGGQLNGFAFYKLAEGITAWFKKLQEPEQTVPNPPAQPQRSRNAKRRRQLVPQSDSQSSVRVYRQNKDVVVTIPEGYTVHVITTGQDDAITWFGPYPEDEPKD